ncbi:FAD-binding oxidoreductase [Halobacteriovorax sp. GB3]|uniref:FAD-binding oxidoreductase n=1 Tax=Halobacteriovorax sp. GB3 TaxID=2719615 RepID=UPI002360F7C0|nr:FAD-binding oxidoreductase [Halobacteriovorax sp. GB3]MDD0851512.1 FAD-binding oxidoreductase [Halobacteriovorax sp. GB3]
MSKELYFKDLDEIKCFLSKAESFIFAGSKTSTVISFDGLKENQKILNLSQLPKKLEFSEGVLVVEGPVSWQEASVYLESKGREIMAHPTDHCACVLAGLATSATGERTFHYGPIRDQILWLEYMNNNGEIHRLDYNKDLLELSLLRPFREELSLYQQQWKRYEGLKNAPYPRFERETDLMIGTEGQLGLITKAAFKTAPRHTSHFLYIQTPRWQESFSQHKILLDFAHANRESLLCAELLDANSLSFAPKELRPFENGDLIFFEVDEPLIETIYEKLALIEEIDTESIQVVSRNVCHELRVSIPRAVNERNARRGVLKKGTDAQVHPDQFEELIDIYRRLDEQGIDSILFGHFGDCHLHFNFLLSAEQEKKCYDLLTNFYQQIQKLNGSPFAEHGIGTIKLEYITDFYPEIVKRVFSLLKKECDPNNIFFPMGFMGNRG